MKVLRETEITNVPFGHEPHDDVDTLFEGKHFFSIFRTFNLKLE